ncbi:hypothetical protein ACHQM5_019404 [Ranunculus cassubicifolius]
MAVATEQDYYEFEMLLGEIPNVTSGNPHSDDSLLTKSSSVFMDLPRKDESRKSSSPAAYSNGYHGSPTGSPNRNVVSHCSPPSKKSNNASLLSFDRRFESNRNLGRSKVMTENGHHLPNKRDSLEDSNLPDDQSLASALTQLNFKDGGCNAEMSPHAINYKNIPKRAVLSEGKYQSNSEKAHTNSDTMNAATVSPRSSNSVNGSTLMNHNADGLEKLDDATMFSELNVQEPKKYRNWSDQQLGEQRECLPMYSGSTPVAQNMHSYQFLPSSYVAGTDYSVLPYPQQYFLNAQFPNSYVQQQQINLSHIPWKHTEEEYYYSLQQQYYMQQLRGQVPETHHPFQVNMKMTNRRVTGNARQSYPKKHNSYQVDRNNEDAFWDNASAQVLDKVRRHGFPEKILTKSHGLNLLKAINASSIGGNDNEKSQTPKYDSLDEVTGKIYLIAKDQNGCRFLQKKFADGPAEDIEKIFNEIINHIVELMTDPFGNYLVQKLLEVCTKDQKIQILHAITRRPGELVRISLDMHGTRAVQKVIETLKTPEQLSLVVSSLKPGIVNLMKDTNGNHVAQRCLQHLLPEYKEFLFEDAISHCSKLAKDRHACCVLQKCLSHCDGEHRRRLVRGITSDALNLSQNQYGNYVVQFVFELRLPWATASLLDKFEGSYGYLSMQKYSSNVVEKCLKFAGEDRRPRIVQELISDSRLDQILQDPYGNYVIQAALSHSKGSAHAALVEAIKPHVPALRTSPYGKKILSSNGLKK